MNLQFSAFVVGAVLLLVAIAGGGFKLIGAELAEKVQNPWLRAIAGIAGAGLIIWALAQGTPKPSSGTDDGQVAKGATGGSTEHPPEARVRMGDLEPGINRQGSDLSNFQADDAAACSTACAHDHRCMAMTFVKHPDAAGGICWLKSDVAARSEAPGMTSAVKMFE